MKLARCWRGVCPFVAVCDLTDIADSSFTYGSRYDC